jgi:hypothetical protein
MNRFQQAWNALLGADYKETISSLEQRLWDNFLELQKVEQLKRDLGLARAAIADLKSKLPSDWEAQQKLASDALGKSVIEDIKKNPQKYIYPAGDVGATSDRNDDVPTPPGGRGVGRRR